MHSFVYGLLGGALIGLSAAVLLLFAGHVLGASGIVSSTILSPITTMRDPCEHWKLVLLSSFALTAHIFFTSEYVDLDGGLASLSPAAYVIGGFFVGFGTKLSNGCTSGHGICGLARFSKRSFAAVGTFMVTAILVAYLTQESTTPFPKQTFQFLRQSADAGPIDYYTKAAQAIVFLVSLAALIAPTFHEDPSANCRTKLAPAAAAGALFSVGLYVARMVYPVVVLGFVNFGLIPQGDWDATLMFVMGSGVVISFLSYQFVDGFRMFTNTTPLEKPIALSPGSDFSVPKTADIDKFLIIGAICFGIGWGISGLCPGPALFLASVGVSWVLVCYWPAFLFGAFLASKIKCRSCENAEVVAAEKEPDASSSYQNAPEEKQTSVSQSSCESNTRV
jgi:hypothetical protein